MRLLLPLLLAIPAAAIAQPAAQPHAAEPPLKGSSTFISPMGEPFRSTDGRSGAEHWFVQTDADHDGRLTPVEMRADADRFFKTLDTDHDGEIGPDELVHYETEVAPEIRVASTYGDPALAKQDSDGKVTDPPYPTRLGAGRFGYLDMPQPVIGADANMDRAVSAREFQSAADRRFKMLDPEGTGAITRAMLPTLEKTAQPKGRRKRT